MQNNQPVFYYSELKRYERKKSFIGHQKYFLLFDILHAQSDTFAAHIDFYDTDADVLMKAYDLCGVGDEAVGELRNVDKAVLMDTDVDEGSEVGDVRHDTGEFHSYDEVGEGMDILVEFEDFNLSTGITPRLLKLGEDVAEGGP